MVVVDDERNTTPEAMMRAYKIVHAIGNTQLGGVRGDCLRDLYQADDVEETEASGAASEFIYILKTL